MSYAPSAGRDVRRLPDQLPAQHSGEQSPGRPNPSVGDDRGLGQRPGPNGARRTNGSDASECLQDAEVQSRRRNASSNRPFTQCQERVPKAEGPEEDRDEVLNPAMERRKTGSSRRNMGGCCVVEDADQNVNHDDETGPGEKETYICSNSPMCGTPRSKCPRHLSSPPVWALEVVRMK
jgi:hypothetical protein